MERRVCRGLNRRFEAGLPDPDSLGDGRTALVLQAAHTVLPEAGVEQLPTLARLEVDRGLRGELRERFAEVAHPDDYWGHRFLVDGSDSGSAATLERWRDELIERLVDDAGHPGALAVADQVHVRRLARGDVPPVVAAECVVWYGAYRKGASSNAAVVVRLVDLSHSWLTQPARRVELDQSMLSAARDAVGDCPDDLLDVEV